MRSIYLAGPDVFRPDAQEVGHQMVETCREFGFRGLFPLASTLQSIRKEDQAREIYALNLALLEKADAVLANLDFFRGSEPDSGTSFEVGFAIARGKPVVGYIRGDGTYAQRVSRHSPHILKSEALDINGWHIEDFGLPINLMLAVSCKVVVGSLRDGLKCLKATLPP